MKLTIEASLHGIAYALREQILPSLQDPFAVETARLAALLLTLCATSVDDLAAGRVAENASLRILFADASSAVENDGLSHRLDEAAGSADTGLKISELDHETARLRTLLVELHAHVELLESPSARSIDHRIWRLLGEIESRQYPG
jgi:hypothetical protein